MAEQDGFLLHTNFIPDAVNLPLIEARERGAGGGHIRFNMAKGSIPSHISQFAVGTYKKGHAHGAGAHVIVLSGEGCSLMWPDGEEPQRYEWQVGTLIVPPNRWFHQHFNSGPTPARYLAFKHFSPRNAQGVPLSWISRRLGGNQIDYADEDPKVRAMFAEALAKHGLTTPRRGARQARPDHAHERGLPERADDAPAQSGLSYSGGRSSGMTVRDFRVIFLPPLRGKVARSAGRGVFFAALVGASAYAQTPTDPKNIFVNRMR
jgi:hypothetical protein